MEKKSKFQLDEEVLKKQRDEMMLDMKRLDDELRRKRKKKIIIVIIIFLSFLAIIKITLGTLEINLVGSYKKEIRFYKVLVNHQPNSVEFTLKEKIPIIPFFINFNRVHLGGSEMRYDEDGIYFYEDNPSKYVIDIKSYNCYDGTEIVECKRDDQKMKENKDIQYTNLKVTRTTKPYEEIYDGKFIKDITKYIDEKGLYYVGITAKYASTEAIIHFYIKHKQENEFYLR